MYKNEVRNAFVEDRIVEDRKNGETLNFLHKKYGISKSTASLWARNVSLEAPLKVVPIEKRKRSRRSCQIWRSLRLERQMNDKAGFDNLSTRLKREFIFREQKGTCLMCGGTEWLGGKIPLEMDHINGDRKNNTRENLRLICPNCHTTTPTYKTKNNKPDTRSDAELIDAVKATGSIYHALLHLNMNPHGGNYRRLRKLMKLNNLSFPDQ